MPIHFRQVLRRDAAALAPDVATLRRMARTGVLRYVNSGSGAGGVLVAESTLPAARHYARLAGLRHLGCVVAPKPEEAGGLSAQTQAKDEGAIHAEDIAVRLGLDTPAGELGGWVHV